MLRNAIVAMIMLLVLPAYACAWYVNATTSPATGQGTISPAGNKSYPAGTNSDEYTVTPAAGYKISRVTLDGAAMTPNSNGKYVAPYLATKSWRYIVAYFAANTVSITTSVSPTGSGAIREDTFESLSNIPVGSSRQLLVLPNPGNVILSLTANGATITDNGDGSRTVVYNNLQANQTVSATFGVQPVVTVDAGNDVQVNGTSAEYAATLYGSAESNQGAISYTWSGAGLTFGTPNAATTTVYAALPGTYTATLTVSTGGVIKSDTAQVTVISRTAYLEGLCTQCHAGTYPEIVAKYDQSKHKTLLNVVVVCQTCHDPNNGGHYSVARPVDVCAGCHVGPYAPTRHTTTTTSCTLCHDAHKGNATGCTACHDCPPQTPSHIKHFGGSEAQAGYGSTKTAQDFSGNSPVYIFGCGNCHPLDFAKHMDGTVDVELYNPQSPTGSIKALNPTNASYVPGSSILTDSKGMSYTNGTCSNVYCHSYNEWTSSIIPVNDPDWAAKTTVTRKYRDIVWGSASLNCSGCHANPPRSVYPANDGGAGNSHSWIDMYGYENLHNYNMAYYYDPISCSYCHNDTVRQKNTYTRDNMDVATLSEVPISNFSKHVNGVNDVAFDRQNPFVYGSSYSSTSMSLANASYDPGTKTCSNVSCHINETSVKWGRPYRWYYEPEECDRCHQMGY